jgi:SAM-dependent methyltransferase
MPIRLDLGCGSAKREGFIGLDNVPAPGVDHVLDLATDRLPFDDRTVDEIFSAHFLEHIAVPNNVFSEIGRVCRDGAKIEIWTPYAFSNEAFAYGHEHFITEAMWTQFCVSHRDYFVDMLVGRWQLYSFTYVIPVAIQADLRRNDVTLDFAVRYLKNVVEEFAVTIEFRTDLDVPPLQPLRFWADTRLGERQDLATTQKSDPPPPPPPPTSIVQRVGRVVVPAALRPPLRRVLTRRGTTDT